MSLFSQRRDSIAFGVMALFGTVAGALAMPIVTSSFATEVVTSGTTEVTLNLEPVLGLWLSSDDFIECSYEDSTTGNTIPVTHSTSGASTCSSPTSSSTFNRTLTLSVLPGSSAPATTTMNARVMTNSSGGYKLYISMADGESQALTKTGESRQISPSSGTITSPLTTANFESNSWGVTGGDLTGWIGVPTYANQTTAGLVKTGKASGEEYGPTTSESDASGYETTTLTFGAKVDSSFPSGSYTGTVLITAVTVE